MPGIIVAVDREWLDIVQRESADRFALGRRDRSRPSWAEPGAPWFLAVDGTVVARGAFVDHELLTPEEAFDQFGYGVGALSVEHLRAALKSVGENDLAGFASLEDLTGLERAWGERELEAEGIALADEGVTRLTAAQTGALLGEG